MSLLGGGHGRILSRKSIRLYDTGSSTQYSLTTWGVGVGGREVPVGGDIVYLRVIDVIVWQKPTQSCKAIIFQLKIKMIIIKKDTKDFPGGPVAKAPSSQCQGVWV